MKLIMPILLAGSLVAAAHAQSDRSSEPSPLSQQAKISMSQAEHTALAKEAGTIQSRELEAENGTLIYSFDIATARGIREVNVNAISGKVVEDSPELPAAESQEKKQEQQEQKKPETAGAPTRPVPVALTNTGEYAENIYDGARSGTWNATEKKLSALRQSVAKLQPATGPEASEIDSALNNLAHSIPARDKIATEKSSNLITRLAAELSSQYRRSVPVEVTLLDYYGRELQINAETKDSAGLRKTAGDLERTWDNLRRQVEQRSPAEATSFGQLVAKIASATTALQYAKLATAELEQVDRLEAVFEKPSATARQP